MQKTTIRFCTFPRTEPPPRFAPELVELFKLHESAISTQKLVKGLTSDGVLAELADGLLELGFEVETGKKRSQKIERPVYYGEGGNPILNYQIDAYQPLWQCGLEIEAGRAWMGNAVYRDLIQASVMVGVDYLCLAVPNAYKFKSSGRATTSKDYESTRNLAEALYGHSRVKLPYGLVVIGY